MLEIADGIKLFRIEMPKNPLKWLNVYTIPGNGKTRNLLVDTGFESDWTARDIAENMSELCFAPEDTDVFLTHMHPDHIGNAAALQRMGCRIIMGSIDYDIIRRIEEILAVDELRYEVEGASLDIITTQLNHDRIPSRFTAKTVEHGDKLEYGEYVFECIHAPGHTPGHMCLYDAERGVMLCGDAVLFDITPNITPWGMVEDSLGNYLQSLRYLSTLDTRLVLPAHRTTNGLTLAERVPQILEHHHRRLASAASIVRAKPGQSAYEICSQMEWHIPGRNWSDYPVSQRFFAFCETLAHLDHLVLNGHIARVATEGIDHEGNQVKRITYMPQDLPAVLYEPLSSVI